MAQRTTTTKVEQLIPDYDSDLSTQPFIDTAVAIVDWLVTVDTDGDNTAALLERIEAYLSAHFYSHKDQFLTSKSTGGASGTFHNTSAMVFMGTPHGQTACALDVTGKLAQRSKETEEGMKRKATVTHIGRNYETDYDDPWD